VSRPRAQGPCAEPDCGQDVVAKGLCNRHYRRMRAEAKAAVEPLVVTSGTNIDEFVLVCPTSLLPVVAAAAELDARAIVRLIWPHLLEAHLAGVEPFTLEPVA